MMRKQIFFSLTLIVSMATQAQQDSTTSEVVKTPPYYSTPEVYHYKPKVDIPLTAVTAAWTFFGFSKIYSKETSTEETINNLSVNNIPRFDRWAADVYSEDAAKTSDLLFYGSIPVPFLLLADKEIRKDAGKIGLLYLEAMSLTGTLYTGSAYAADRFRPYAYNANASMGDRREGNARNSFFAGHVALVGTATFFAAKVYSDYHPGAKKWLLFGTAGLATATTGYLRHRGGRHFPSDILIGSAVGTLSGILVPHFHKNKLFKNPNLSLLPFTGSSHGLLLTYKL